MTVAPTIPYPRRIEMPLESPDGCYHGGAFFTAIGECFDTLERRRHVINADVLDAWFEPSPKVQSARAEREPHARDITDEQVPAPAGSGDAGRRRSALG